MTLYIDNRAGSGDLVEYKCISDLKPEVTTLHKGGDVVFTGQGSGGSIEVAIEVKSLDDFLGSAKGGRLQSQMRRMHDNYDRNWIIVYGIWRPSDKHDGIVQFDPSTGWRRVRLGDWRVPYKYLRAVITSVMSVGFSYYPVSVKAEAAEQIAAAYRWYQKPWKEHQLFEVIEKIRMTGLSETEGKLRKVASRIAAFDGIGPRLGVDLAKHFGCFLNLAMASAEEIKEVPGIGDTIAEAICYQLRESVYD